MPRPQVSPKKPPVQPFSLILEPSELAALRKIAGKEKTSVAAIIQRAIHRMPYRANLAFVHRRDEVALDGSSKLIGDESPLAGLAVAKRSASIRLLVTEIR